MSELSGFIPRLCTQRLVLRAPELADVDAIHEVHRHAEVAAGVLSIAHPHRPADARAWLERFRQSLAAADPIRRNVIWLICLADTGEVVGDCGLSCNTIHRRGTLGYLVRPDHWNRGVVTEALACVLAWAFEVMDPPLRRVQADHFPENPASGRVLEKLGFTREGLMRGFLLKNGEPRDVVRWAVLREEYAGQELAPRAVEPCRNEP